jgi:hypothetical protein
VTVNTRRGGGVDLPARIRRRRAVTNQEPEMNPPLNPPPARTDVVVATQMKLLQQMANTMAEMQAQLHQDRQQSPPPPPPAPPRDKHREFMSHKPPTFSSPLDPLQADDWLKSMEKMLNIAQCTNREKVLYASGRLTGPAVDWWDAYSIAHAAADTISWAEFSTDFRNYHIPAGLMKINKKEFLSLKQGGMSVREYRDKFIQLSRYAHGEVDDKKKHELFLEGLIGPLQYQSMSHSFQSFQKLLDKAIALEHKRVELDEMKRKATNQGQARISTRPHYTTPQGTPARGSSEQQSQQVQTTPQASTPVGPVAPNASTNRSCFKCGHAEHYVNYCPSRVAYTTLAPMKQGQVFGEKSQALSVNRGQVNHVEGEAEPEELENKKRWRLKVKKMMNNKLRIFYLCISLVDEIIFKGVGFVNPE